MKFLDDSLFLSIQSFSTLKLLVAGPPASCTSTDSCDVAAFEYWAYGRSCWAV